MGEAPVASSGGGSRDGHEALQRGWGRWIRLMPVLLGGLLILAQAARSLTRSHLHLLLDNAGVAVFLRDYPKALCLDGSPALYYWRPGRNVGRSKFLIFFEGGGFCSDPSDCRERARGYYGSTSSDPPRQILEEEHPFLTTDRRESPLMWDWNQVFVRYCDGAYFSGYRREAQSVGGAEVYYRGLEITRALFADLSRHRGLDRATDVVLSGCSAGAIRVFAHADALAQLVPAPRARVAAFPDSGFYLDKAMFTPLKRFVVDPAGQSASALLSRRCVQENEQAAERCLLAAVAAPFLETPAFAWQSRYDLDQRSCEMSTACAGDDTCVAAYGRELSAEVQSKLLARPANGAFLDGCNRHCAAGHLPRDDAPHLTALRPALF